MAVSELLEKVNGLSAQERQQLFIGAAEKLTLVEILGLVKAMEDKWDVKATGGGGMMVAMPAAGGGAAAPAEEVVKTDFDLFLKDAGQKKIAIIKVVRELTNLALKDAKALVDKAPCNIKEKMPKEDAEKAKAALEAEGATVELK